jgi:hypothetical protein
MNFIKKNALLMGMVAVFIVLTSLSGLFLSWQIQAYTTAAEQFSTKSAERTSLWANKPFPSAKNIEQLKLNKEKYEEALKEPLAELTKSAIPTSQIRDIDSYQTMMNSWQSMNDLLSLNGVQCPPKFLFGFDRYTSGKFPKPEDTPMLQKQLKITEEIIKLAAEAHLAEIVKIQRVTVEADAPAGNNASGKRGSQPVVKAPVVHKPDQEPLISMGQDFAYVNSIEQGYLYSTMPFTLEFKCSVEALRSFLNGLAHSRYILVPRLFNIESDNKKGAVAGGGSESVLKGSAAGNRRGSPSPLAAAPAPLTQEQQMMMRDKAPFVMGEEKLNVGMRIEWLEFSKKQEAANK